MSDKNTTTNQPQNPNPAKSVQTTQISVKETRDDGSQKIKHNKG